MTFNTLLAATATLAIGASAALADTGGNPQVGGADMFPAMNIVENAMNSPIHTTLVAAVVQAELVDVLQGDGPFTVFAPTDDAFGMITEESLMALMEPEAKGQLTEILTCHVVGAAAFSDTIMGMVADGGGMHQVETLGGCMLTAEMKGDALTLTDENGREATVTVADVAQSNGVIHVIDRVLLPRQ